MARAPEKLGLASWLIALAIAALACDFGASSEDSDVALAPTNPEEQAAALAASLRFLDLVDENRIQDTWPEMSDSLRRSTDLSLFKGAVSALRADFGQPNRRAIATVEYLEDPPDAPSGRYFVIEFATSFERISATERIVSAYEDGQWRIAGYHIKERPKAR